MLAVVRVRLVISRGLEEDVEVDVQWGWTRRASVPVLTPRGRDRRHRRAPVWCAEDTRAVPALKTCRCFAVGTASVRLPALM